MFNRSVKPTKYAPLLCTIFMIIAIVGIAFGMLFNLPIVTIIFLIPTALYEAYRTTGRSTKTASIILLLVLVAQIFLVLFNVRFNIADFLGADRQLVGGMWVPLGEIQLVGPTVIAVLSVVLFTKTRGIYTKWLAAVIFISTLAILYLMDPVVFQDLLRLGIQRGLRGY